MYEFIDGGLSHSINSDETTPHLFFLSYIQKRHCVLTVRKCPINVTNSLNILPV